jgi:peptidoglycan/LPS O-acetylase OafA/YrhL
MCDRTLDKVRNVGQGARVSREQADGRIAGLDGLRALAVTFVFLEHRSTWGPLLGGGEAGVMLFFVLSGYLITSILLRDREKIEAGASDVKSEIYRFFLNRSFRIFPPYYAMLAILAVICLVAGIDFSPLWAAAYVTYTTNIGSAYFEHSWAPLGHLWSLAVEEQFYVLAAPLFLFTPRRFAKYLVAGLLALGAATWIVLTVVDAPAITFAVDSFINFAMLSVGSALALTVRVAKGRSSLAIVLGFLLLLGPQILTLIYPPLQAFKPFSSPEHLATAYAAVIVFGVVQNQDSTLVRWLSWAPLRQIGRISYAFYLWHYVIDGSFARPWMEGVLGSRFVAAGVIGVLEFAVTLAIAALSWRLIEAPALRFRTRILARPSSVTGAVSEARP